MNQKHFIISLLFSLFLVWGAPLSAETFPEGAGIVYGEGFAFNLKAPKGWTLDNSSAVNQGVQVVFYPNGSNWADSVVVAYAQSRPKTPQVSTAEQAAQDTIKKFHQSGSSNMKGKQVKTLKTDAGQDAVIWQFSGDEFNNQEAAAYFVEKDRINFIVMSSRDKAAFDRSMAAFESLAKSYKPMTATISKPSP